MLTFSGTELCRLTVRAPECAFEITVPTGIPLIELLPVLVSYAGEELHEAGLEHDGWVVQRLGSEPLDEELTVAALGLVDGEVLHLRPRREQLPPVHFDDLTDGVATALRSRPDAWRPEYSRRLLLGGALAALAAGLVILLEPGPVAERAGAAAVVAVLALLGAVVLSRAADDVAAGGTLGAAAVPYVAFAGALLPSGPSGSALDGERLLAASVAGAAAVALALAGTAAMAPLMLGLALLAALGTACGALMMGTGLSAAAAAAVCAGVTVIVGLFVPGIAFRLSGLTLPRLPSDAAELQEEIDPYPSRDVISRTQTADHYMTGLYAASGVAAAVALTVLGRTPRWPELALGGTLSLVLLLHGRGLAGGWQKLSAILPGAYGAVLLGLVGTWRGSPSAHGLALLAAVACAVILVLCARALPGTWRLPYWGRAADIAQSVAAMALIPLVLEVTGVYGLVHGIRL